METLKEQNLKKISNQIIVGVPTIQAIINGKEFELIKTLMGFEKTKDYVILKSPLYFSELICNQLDEITIIADFRVFNGDGDLTDYNSHITKSIQGGFVDTIKDLQFVEIRTCVNATSIADIEYVFKRKEI